MKNFYSLMMQNFFAIIILFLSAVPVFSQSTYTISYPEGLEDQNYDVAGDAIILANTIYNADERIALNPILHFI